VLMMERRGRVEVEARDFTSQTVGLCHTSLIVEFTLIFFILLGITLWEHESSFSTCHFIQRITSCISSTIF
jgi:hypothetical protein